MIRNFSKSDFTDPRCRDTPEIPPERFPDEFDPEKHEYGVYLDVPEWRAAVECNRRALERCDAVVVLPCGADSHADWAYALGRGALSVVVGTQRKGERTPTHLWADMIVQSDSAVPEALDYILTVVSELGMPQAVYDSFAKDCDCDGPVCGGVLGSGFCEHIKLAIP